MKKFLCLSLLTATMATVSLAKDASPAVSLEKEVASLKSEVAKLKKKTAVTAVVSATDVAGSAESQDLQKEIMALREKYEGQVIKIDNELKALVAQAQSAAQAKLTTKVAELQDQIQAKQQERELTGKKAERGLQTDAQALVEKSQKRFLDAVQKVADKKGVDVVHQREAVLHIKPGSHLDITKEVIGEWDKAYHTLKGKPAPKK